FVFDASPTPLLYTLSLHDALPILAAGRYHLFRADHAADPLRRGDDDPVVPVGDRGGRDPGHAHPSSVRARPAPDALVQRMGEREDRKSTRLNSSHSQISYAVFCLK